MKKYEGLFILNTAGKEEGIKEMIDRISADITAAGGKVDTVQKMDKRAFSRVVDKRVPSGFYVNVIFDAEPGSISALTTKFSLNDEVYRVLFTTVTSSKLLPIPEARTT